MLIVPKPYPKEFSDDVVNVARNREPGQHIKQIAADFGIRESCLTNWMKAADVEDGVKPGTTAAENADLREATGLHSSDVDLDGGVLRVRWTLTRTSKGLQLGEPKTEKSRRAVPLPRSTVDVLRAHQTRQAAERVAAQEVWRDSDLVFTTEIGTPLEPRNVLRRFELLAPRAGLRGVHLHTLRHSTASFLLAAGTHTKVVQEHLGHSSYAITADIYSHVAPEQKREAADRLDAALNW